VHRFWGRWRRVTQKKTAVMVAASIGILGYGGSWFLYTPVIPWLQTIASGTMGLAAAGLWMLHGSIGADVIDYDELTMGIRREGSFTACGSYVLKLGNSMGGFVAGLNSWLGRIPIHPWCSVTEYNILDSCNACSIPVVGLFGVILIISKLDLTKQKCEEYAPFLKNVEETYKTFYSPKLKVLFDKIISSMRVPKGFMSSTLWLLWNSK